ncbi:uncharacterized protein K452DRAFT_286634 [Aplosporella prunicola CBS 121167]|uniref:F-box domain-containing protein n=1 Tax=Aplosporella prunicola CBS 121167 TaxID=1176127 RepID=A0A6A6BID4_9PEZI|nr:uncharacterized protein K452DRAFT_286634 [Aplosporella prunicola CBS 121167]KAF2143004.1 hypothetical protein K452DRAFT_286634 [Aplosporella prunicola CBS 121167]
MDMESPLLRLPSEIRGQILEYVLPTTTRIPSKHDANGLVWLRGHNAVLATCRQLHEEGAAIIYGQNTFVIEVSYDRISFRFRWLLPANCNLAPNRAFSFLDHFSQRNIQRIKNYYIKIDHVDSYTGMIKFNCGGRGLTDGLREKVRQLMTVLRCAGELNRVEVRFVDSSKRPRDTQVVLEPLLVLREVRRARVRGDVMAEFGEHVERKMSMTAEQRRAEQVVV